MPIIKEILIRTGFLAYGCFGVVSIIPNLMASDRGSPEAIYIYQL